MAATKGRFVECGAFTAALVRTPRQQIGGHVRPQRSGAEVTALQTLARRSRGHKITALMESHGIQGEDEDDDDFSARRDARGWRGAGPTLQRVFSFKFQGFRFTCQSGWR